jgi:hypothetical protein
MLAQVGIRRVSSSSAPAIVPAFTSTASLPAAKARRGVGMKIVILFNSSLKRFHLFPGFISIALRSSPYLLHWLMHRSLKLESLVLFGVSRQPERVG